MSARTESKYFTFQKVQNVWILVENIHKLSKIINRLWINSRFEVVIVRYLLELNTNTLLVHWASSLDRKMND